MQTTIWTGVLWAFYLYYDFLDQSARDPVSVEFWVGQFASYHEELCMQYIFFTPKITSKRVTCCKGVGGYHFAEFERLLCVKFGLGLDCCYSLA